MYILVNSLIKFSML